MIEIKNYLRNIKEKHKLYILTNKKILDLLNNIYNEIKITKTAKKRWILFDKKKICCNVCYIKSFYKLCKNKI